MKAWNKIKEYLWEALMLAGFVLIVVATFRIDTTAGLYSAGASALILVALHIVFERKK